MTNTPELWLHFMRQLFERPRSADLQKKIGPLVWPILVGVAKLDSNANVAGGWKNQLQFRYRGQSYYVRARHVERTHRLPRRIEICKAVGTRSIPVASFHTLAQAEAFARRPTIIGATG